MPEIRALALPSGEPVPVLGQGTWGMGEKHGRRAGEIAALRLGLDLGMTLIDTAEMYADGGAEQVVAEAIAGRSASVFLVSKVLPRHATRPGTIAACHASLKRLGVERLDLYLLHWRGDVPLHETVAAFQDLTTAGDIRQWGVSNFDTADMEELVTVPGGDAVACNQVLYNLARRGIEFDLLPWCREWGVPVMAYSPIEQGRLTTHHTLERIARRIGASAAQVALAWVLHQDGALAIPKSSHPDHVRENREALEITLTPEDAAELDRAFRSPSTKTRLEMI